MSRTKQDPRPDLAALAAGSLVTLLDEQGQPVGLDEVRKIIKGGLSVSVGKLGWTDRYSTIDGKREQGGAGSIRPRLDGDVEQIELQRALEAATKNAATRAQKAEQTRRLLRGARETVTIYEAELVRDEREDKIAAAALQDARDRLAAFTGSASR